MIVSGCCYFHFDFRFLNIIVCEVGLFNNYDFFFFYLLLIIFFTRQMLHRYLSELKLSIIICFGRTIKILDMEYQF